jgi:hypothetical protein
VLEDFRKVASMIASGIVNKDKSPSSQGLDTLWRFIHLSVNKFTSKKVKDFMEI